MKHFQFRLGRLARVREIEEELARERWLSAERAARDAEELAVRARAEFDAATAALRAEQSCARIVPAAHLVRLQLLEPLNERRRAAQERARKSRSVSEGERAAWITHKQKVESLERLELRDRELHRAASSASEAAVIDEIAAVRAERKARAETAENQAATRRTE